VYTQAHPNKKLAEQLHNEKPLFYKKRQIHALHNETFYHYKTNSKKQSSYVYAGAPEQETGRAVAQREAVVLQGRQPQTGDDHRDHALRGALFFPEDQLGAGELPRLPRARRRHWGQFEDDLLPAPYT